MNTIIIELPRQKEQQFEKLLLILTNAIKEEKEITHFHVDKCRNTNNTTLYVICYIDNK